MPNAAFVENQIQLDALHDLTAIFRDHGLPFWLRGGWALDFLLGQETRPHGDVDLVTLARHWDSVKLLMGQAGWSIHDRGFLAQQDDRKDGVKVSVAFVEPRSDGTLTLYRCPHLHWLPDALGGKRSLHGLSCLTLTPQQLVHEKENYEGHQPLRQKDVQSLQFLRALLEQGERQGLHS